MRKPTTPRPAVRARLVVNVVNDGPITSVLDDLRLAMMKTGHGPRINIRTDRWPFQPLDDLGLSTTPLVEEAGPEPTEHSSTIARLTHDETLARAVKADDLNEVARLEGRLRDSQVGQGVVPRHAGDSTP